MVVGGTLSLSDVEIRSTMASGGSVPAYGAVFRGGATIDTARLVLADNGGYGAIHDDTTAAHLDLIGERNAQPALWVQACPSFALSGAASRIADNGLGGIVAVDVASLQVRDAAITTTRTLTRLVGTDAIQVGDGIHLDLATTAGVRIADVRLTDNERAGMLVSTAEATVADTAIGAVEVSGASLGVVAQSDAAVITSGTWDSSVVRGGATIVNDAAFATRLDIVGAVAPMFFPAE
jgi:hypothetical protein